MNSRRFENKFVGSKGAPGVYHKIINLVPRGVETFIECFAGEATIARIMAPTKNLILVDKVQQPGLAPELLARANFIRGCGIAFLDGYRWTGKEFVYGDPPYLLEARNQRGRHYYENEMQRPDHVRFLRVAKSINCRVLISGYHSPLYDEALAGWSSREFEVMTRAGTKATEVLWWNYETPTELHDWRFVGDTWPERRNLTKKIRRAMLDLVSMPPLHRGRFMHELAQAMRSTAAGNGRAGLPAAAPAEISREISTTCSAA